ncbi:glycosyltransferase family 9 protein [Chitinophagaceae bacterium MMS25-I14]
MSKRWTRNKPPKRILAIRLQAMGDVVITLPYLQHLRNSLPPETVIDFLTREETEAIPKNLVLFDNVYSIGGGRDFKKQFVYTCLLIPKLLFRKYDVIIDLQNNKLSRLVCRVLQPKAWCAFDRFSPIAAGERNRRTIESVGLGDNKADNNLKLKLTSGIDALLERNGRRKEHALVILNPAGAFENRNWPTDRYIEFTRLWLQQYPLTQFAVLGVDRAAEKAEELKEALGAHFINLVNQTTPAQAFAVIQKAAFVLSEDSGLMHMAWVSGIPTFAIFGSTRSDWSRPLGLHTAFLDSSDMPCGNCMLEVCKLDAANKNLCMTRYSAAFVFERAMMLFQSISSK